jgi:hypothetical protein
MKKTDGPAEICWKDRLSLLAPAEESTVKIGEIWEYCTVLKPVPDEYTKYAFQLPQLPRGEVVHGWLLRAAC